MENISLKSRSENGSYFAFFDLDRTITGAISGKELARLAFKKGIMKLPDMVRAIYLSMLFKSGLISQPAIIDEIVKWVKDMPEDTMVDLCNEVSVNVLIPSIYKESREEIKLHKMKTARVVILSSTLNHVGRIMAQELNMDDIICSDLEVEDGLLTGKPKGNFCFGPEKLVRMKEYCEINNTDYSDTWYYADSISDLPVLMAVGNPVCVNPDKKLLKEAKKRGWPVRFWK